MDVLTTLTEYDTSGRHSLDSWWDYGGDGTSDLVIAEERYDASGRLRWYAQRSERNYDGIPDDTRETSLDEAGRKLSEGETHDHDRDGVIDFSRLETNVYDDLGRTVATRVTLHTPELNQVLSYDVTFDAAGGMRQVNSEDLDADGSIDRIMTFAFTFMMMRDNCSHVRCKTTGTVTVLLTPNCRHQSERPSGSCRLLDSGV